MTLAVESDVHCVLVNISNWGQRVQTPGEDGGFTDHMEDILQSAPEELYL